MRQLTESYRLNISHDQLEMIRALKRYRIVPAKFIRDAIAEKYNRELPEITKPKSLIPF